MGKVISDRRERTEWFKAVIVPHEPAVRRHLKRVGYTPSDIDDLVAEAETKAYASDQWLAVQNGRAYFFAIIRNLVLDDARRRKIVSFETFADFESLNLVDDQPDAETIVTARDELKRLRYAVSCLPERTRYVFLRRRIDEIPAEVVADELHVGVSTIDKHLARALLLLTNAMSEQDQVSKGSVKTPWRLGKLKR